MRKINNKTEIIIYGPLPLKNSYSWQLSYFNEGLFHKALIVYIDTYFADYNIKKYNTIDCRSNPCYAMIGKKKYSLYDLFYNLHKTKITKKFTGEELCTIHEMRSCPDSSVNSLARSLIEKMGFKYQSFVLISLRISSWSTNRENYSAYELYVITLGKLPRSNKHILPEIQYFMKKYNICLA